MEIRHTTPEDIPFLEEVFATARDFMIATGNPTQWTDGYPKNELVLEDISYGDSFVCIEDGTIVGSFVLRPGNDPTYEKIYEGAWKNNKPYATIHRIASNGKVKGVFAKAIEYALQHYSTIRIDTHKDNVVMQHLVKKAGFEYCGIIYCWDGSERLAYQLN